MSDGDQTGDHWQTTTCNSGLSQASNTHIEINQSDQAWNAAATDFIVQQEG